MHAEPLATIDLDIFFLFAEKQPGPILTLDKISEFSARNGFSFDHEFINIDGWLVQFIESSGNPIWTEAVESAQPIKVGERETWVIDKEHLDAMWLYAGRAKDYQKLATFVESGILDDGRLSELLERFGLAAKWEAEKWRFENET